MLKDLEVRTAKIDPKPYKLTDAHGLYLLVNPNGAKYWRYDYKFDNKRKTLALGVYPKVTLKQARVAHKNAIDLLKEGIDPSQKRQNEIQAIKREQATTFKVVALDWWDYWHVGKEEKYARFMMSRFEELVFPVFGDKPIKEVTIHDLKHVTSQLVRRGAFDVAKRNLQKMNQVMRFAYLHEYIDTLLPEIKPSDLIPSRRRKNFSRIAGYEIPKLLQDIQNYEGSPITILAIKLMLLTFVRTNELIHATWQEFDVDNRRWIIPASRMKMDRDHIVPLSDQVIDLLHRLMRYSSDTPWLFPSSIGGRGYRPISNNTVLFALYRMGYKGKMTGHGFRGLASTMLHEMDFNHQHIELQLAHMQDNRVSAAYNHASYLPQRAAMMQAWADFIYKQAPRGF